MIGSNRHPSSSAKAGSAGATRNCAMRPHYASGALARSVLGPRPVAGRGSGEGRLSGAIGCRAAISFARMRDAERDAQRVTCSAANVPHPPGAAPGGLSHRSGWREALRASRQCAVHAASAAEDSAEEVSYCAEHAAGCGRRRHGRSRAKRCAGRRYAGRIRRRCRGRRAAVQRAIDGRFGAA